MAITNPGFEDAGVGQGEADGWTATTSGDAQGYAAIEAGDGFLYAWEGFDGWVSGQADYREAFASGDRTAGTVETFEAWASGQEEYREAFASGDNAQGTTEIFDTWTSALADYRADGFEVGDVTGGTTETFEAWIASLSDYRPYFEPSDTTDAVIATGPSSTGAAETFAGCRADVAVAATATSTTISAPGHTFEVADPVRLEVAGNGALFGPFLKLTTYYVKTASAGVSVTLAATEGGSAITATASGEATLVGDEAFFWRNPVTAW